MIVYAWQVEKSGDFFRRYSPQYTSVNGFGFNDEDAISDFFVKFHQELNRIINNGENFPKPLSRAEILDSHKNGNIFSVPAPIALTMYLHKVMIDTGVKRTDLAKLLALTSNEVAESDWQLEKLLKLEPQSPSKYKKVQRLLDVRHDSTLTEMREAFRVMDYNIDFIIGPKSPVGRESIVEL